MNLAGDPETRAVNVHTLRATIRRGRPAGYGIPGLGEEGMLDKFGGEERRFRGWKEDFLDFAEMHEPGLRMVLEDIARDQRRTCGPIVRQNNGAWRGTPVDRVIAYELWMALDNYTEGDAKRTLERCEGYDGFEAWREIMKQHDPNNWWIRQARE